MNIVKTTLLATMATALLAACASPPPPKAPDPAPSAAPDQAPSAAPEATAAPAEAPPEAAPAFSWSEKPSLEDAPKGDVWASLRDKPVGHSIVTVVASPKKALWTLIVQTTNGSEVRIVVKGAPKVGTVKQAMGRNGVGVDYSEEEKAGASAKSAAIIELTSLKAPTGKEPHGTAEGRFVVVIRDADHQDRKSWAAGSFSSTDYTSE